jgi:threonine/homoserine/homoserine lactone efflux protein
MDELPVLLAFWGAFALAVMSPGPNFAVMLSTALRLGRPAALRLVAGIIIGEAVWGMAAVFGVAALAAQHHWIALALRIGGGGFLLYLAFMSARAALRRDHAPVAAAMGGKPERGGVGRGLMLMLLNAKAGVFWISLTSVFLGPQQGLSLGLMAVAGAVAISLLWHSLLAVAFTTAAVLRLYARVRRGLEATLGVVMAALGIRLIALG